MMNRFSAERASTRIRTYNIAVNVYCLVYVVALTIIYFLKRDVDVRWILYSTMITRLGIFIIYSWTTVSLWLKMRIFRTDAMNKERCSIMTQFIAFLLSISITVAFDIS